MGTMATASLNSLLAAVSTPQASKQDWEQLYHRLWPYAFAIVYRGLCGNRALAEDLCQEVMLRLIRSVRPEDFVPGQVLSFVRTACYRVIVDYRRKEGGQRQIANPDSVPASGPSPEAEAIEHDLAASIRSRLTRSDVQLAQLLGEGATVDTIAETLEISRQTAYVRRHRLKRRVQQIADELGAAT